MCVNSTSIVCILFIPFANLACAECAIKLNKMCQSEAHLNIN